MSLQQQAEECFRCGRVEECAELLKSASAECTHFSRAQWRTTANLLACKMKMASDCNDVDQIVQVQGLYTSLWEQIVGLPLTTDSLLTEMTVTFALCQLEHILTPTGRLVSSTAVSCVLSHCQRLCEYSGIEWVELATSLPHLVTRLGGAVRELLLKTVYVTAVLKMRCPHSLREGLSLMATLQSVVSQSGDSEELCEIELTLKVKDALNADCGDLEYLRAWRQYRDGGYMSALSMLRSAPTSPVASLLRGHCFNKLGKPQSALCCYLACLTSDNRVASLPAMASCCMLYRQTSNSRAELEARTLRLKALQNDGRCVSEGVLWWRGEGLYDDPVQLSETQWAESAYITSIRAIHCNKHDVAATVLSQLVESGHLPSSVPPASLLYLLLAKSLYLSGDPGQTWVVCNKLINHLSILELEECGPHPLLRLTQSLLLGALSLTETGDRDRAKCISHKSYQVCGFLISRLCAGTESTREQLEHTTVTLMELSLSLMAILLVRVGERDKALSLLIQAASLSLQPTLLTVYNYCLLLTQLGKLKEAAHCWLKRRELSPSNKSEARHMIIDKTSSKESDFDQLDVAMLKIWIRQR